MADPRHEDKKQTTPDAGGNEPVSTPDSPIVQKLDVSRADLRKSNPASSGHTAIVYLTKRGEYQLGVGRLTMGEVWLATPKEMYKVDTTPHNDTFSMKLPALEEALFFSAKVRVVWRIADPIAAVRTMHAGHVNPRQVIENYLEERLRDVTRGFEVERNADAEREIARTYGDRVVEITEAIQVTRCTAVLDLDEQASTYLAGGRKVHWELTAEDRAHQVEKQRKRNASKLRVEEMNVYAEAIRKDDYTLLGALLADHGDNAKEVISLLMEQKKIGFDQANIVLHRLLEANLVNHKDVATLMAEASKTVTGVSVDAKKPPAVPAKASRIDAHDDEDEDDDGDER